MALRLTIPTFRGKRRIIVESVPPLDVEVDVGYVFEPFEIQLPVAAKEEAGSGSSSSSIPTEVVDDLVQVLLGRWDFQSNDGFPGWSMLLCQMEEQGGGGLGGGGGGGGNNNNNNPGNNISPLLFNDVRPICTWNLPLKITDEPDDVELKLHNKLSQTLKLLGNMKKKQANN
eukprot:CAMPEP_0113465698 /NCGR_PEP_ID=MMETSP0014_2-20120614/13880_1 /TAXON_ID=2857 /ORGANISM="Nitzschia sp." /LENGTH=171 /DNA_ID=CAMNT_0000357877 /DNA_START=223 /DNA_END=738 /DNA_ORIENTATION=+ /assembly_acc=CAM_ASM_000159